MRISGHTALAEKTCLNETALASKQFQRVLERDSVITFSPTPRRRSTLYPSLEISVCSVF